MRRRTRKRTKRRKSFKFVFELIRKGYGPGTLARNETRGSLMQRAVSDIKQKKVSCLRPILFSGSMYLK